MTDKPVKTKQTYQVGRWIYTWVGCDVRHAPLAPYSDIKIKTQNTSCLIWTQIYASMYHMPVLNRLKNTLLLRTVCTARSWGHTRTLNLYSYIYSYSEHIVLVAPLEACQEPGDVYLDYGHDYYYCLYYCCDKVHTMHALAPISKEPSTTEGLRPRRYV